MRISTESLTTFELFAPFYEHGPRNRDFSTREETLRLDFSRLSGNSSDPYLRPFEREADS